MNASFKRVFVISFIALLGSISLSLSHNKDEKKMDTYPTQWKKVDSLESNGLYRMALAEVNKIFDAAVLDKNHTQVIKSVLYELKYNTYLEEDDYVIGIARLEDLVVKVPSPSKEILHSLLAEVYWGYYSANSYNFSDRTSVVDVDLKDIRTWDLKRIAVKIRDHYVQSLMHESILQSTAVGDYSEIISSYYNDIDIRPTLFDFLGHRALDFFKSNTFELAGPAETFVMDNEAYFQTNSAFLKLNVATKDSLNTRFLAVRILHALTQFNSSQKNLKPLFYLEMERLEFAHSYATLSDKDNLYEKGIERLAESYKGHDFSSEAWYKIAERKFSLGSQYNPNGDTTARWLNKEAYAMCENTMQIYPGAFGSQQCEALKTQILEKSLEITAEEVIAPNQLNKFLLTYKNVSAAVVKIVKIDYNDFLKYRNDGDKLYKEIKRSRGVYTENLDLTHPKDFNAHSTEFQLPALEAGFYYIAVSSDGNFNHDEEGYCLIPIWVSQMTLQYRKMDDYSEVMISNRTTGKAIEGAKVAVFYQEYNYDKRAYENKLVGNYYTDEKGRIMIKNDLDHRNYNMTIYFENEVYSPGDGIYMYRNYAETDNTISTNLFTDRKIYRPGQSIYFKGILIQNKGKERVLLKNYQTNVSFYDANNQLIKSQILTSNQFGSFQGSFEAPFGVLTGAMRIETPHGSTTFRVEEYKRPKFKVEMDPIEGEFQLNDSITATGFAEAYAGNKIDGANVTYRITRGVEYNWHYWWRWYSPSEPKEIANGKLITDENGAFKVVFKALPDLESDPKNLPIFTYTIAIDVTDINGETHSTTSSIRAGYQSLELSNNLRDELDNTSDFFLRLSTTNLNGQPIAAAGNIIIEKLKLPQQVYYNRLWQKPDRNFWTAEEFRKLFPNESYSTENDQQTWSSESTVFQEQFNTAKSDSIPLKNYKTWEPGVYKYTAIAKDKNGIPVQDERYFTIYNPTKTTAPSNDMLWVKSLQDIAEPGETVTILLASMEKELVVNYETEANGKLIESKSITLNQEQRKLEFKMTEAYRGNFTIHISTIKNSRQFNQSIVIIVPYTNKELDLNFSTFRNKLLPGAEEEWVMTVKNKYGEKEQAELLATLYDASLDALFTPNDYYLNIYRSFYGTKGWNAPFDMSTNSGGNINYDWNTYGYTPNHYYPSLNYFGWTPYYYGPYRFLETISFSDGYAEEDAIQQESPGSNTRDVSRNKKLDSFVGSASAKEGGMPTYGWTGKDEASGAEVDSDNREQDGKTGEDAALGELKARANFNETAFFFPQLLTDADGTIKIKFTIPESLTKWRFLGLAHTQNLKIGTISRDVVTQKELMVVPNAPRFLREGDKITISTKISNISDKDLVGKVQLTLYDPFTEKEIGSAFQLPSTALDFNAEKGKSTSVSWTINVPYTYSAVKYKIVAKAGDFSDGEENVLPILSNRMLVTESLPFPIRGNQEKTFEFKKLGASANSTTLKNHSYTLEFTSNPAWYAIQAMPYMMEYPHECAEQTFTRYYSNAIASHIMNSSPKIKKIIEEWGENSPEAFLSNLQKNQELKAVILEETPWVLDAQNEEASKRNLAVLLDMGRMSRELDKALTKTIQTQSSNGAWPWFPGMPESRYITQHIVTGMGHLDHLGIKDIRDDGKVWSMITKAIHYLDGEIARDFEYAKRYDANYLKNQHIGYSQIQYLYARSYFPEVDMSHRAKEAVNYYQEQAKTYWLQFNIYAEGMIALAAHRFELKELSTAIVKSLKDRSIQSEEFGMYWKDFQMGYYWYEAPIETQALMIEVFDEVTNDQAAVEELKIWLLKQKQTTNWKTTKQTTEAVYALLLKGTDLLSSDEMVAITVGGKAIEYVAEPQAGNPYQVKAQAGTGYIKTVWQNEAVKPEMSKITVSKKTNGVAWGAAYWQYFEDLDKITFAETNLKLKKDLFIVNVSNQGEQLMPITKDNALTVGQKVRVRIELRTDRNLEYVHLKDMRAAGFEPIDVLSRYHYQGGLGYYQSTKDAATHFFFDYIPKGTYVFEYDLRVQQKGEFSNGIATIQCMYAPEFTSHSDGIRVKVN